MSKLSKDLKWDKGELYYFLRFESNIRIGTSSRRDVSECTRGSEKGDLKHYKSPEAN